MDKQLFEERLYELEATGQRVDFPVEGRGTIPFRVWTPYGDQLGGELLVMLHGGSGSWNHWYRNTETLSNYYELVIPDLPGLGDALDTSDTDTPETVAALLAEGVKSVVGQRHFHLVCFSWGCAVGAQMAALFQGQLKSIFLVGPSSMGKMPSPPAMGPLTPLSRSMSEEALYQAHRENLGILMLADRQKIDEFSVFLHGKNLARARFRSPRFAGGRWVLEGLKASGAPTLVLFGAEDASAVPNLETREAHLLEARPDALFEVIPGVGHWLPYEAPDQFNQRCVDWIEANIWGP